MYTPISNIQPDLPEPAWEVARLFPAQGSWSEAEYLDLPGSRLTEFDHGRIEVLEMPSELHQLLVLFLYEALVNFVRPRGLGVVVVAPLPVRLWEGTILEPDIAFMGSEHAERRHPRYWREAYLVMEVLSPNGPERDRETKRREYAQAGIPEYWVVDPAERTVTVFGLPADAGSSSILGVRSVGELAVSNRLPGFAVDLEASFSVDDRGF